MDQPTNHGISIRFLRQYDIKADVYPPFITPGVQRRQGMGQAFDHEGNLMGDAFGPTKREVFDALMKQHPDAAEVRIKSIEVPASGSPWVRAVEMPKYRCHKEVWALKIKAIVKPHAPGQDDDGSRFFVFEDADYGVILVSSEYMVKHRPVAGGYFVRYKDGYASFSPADAFEDGYTRL